MRFWDTSYTFNHPWSQVAQAAWRKYPNPMNPAVTSIDVLERRVENGVLHTHRVISSQWGMPGWVQTIMGSPNLMYANERSEVDPIKQMMTLKTRNITFCKHISVDETLVYQRHPENPEQTLLSQHTSVFVDGVPLSGYLEQLLTSTIDANAKKGRQAMEWVLRKINDEMKEFSAMISLDSQ